MVVTVKVPDELAARAKARGVSVEVYVEEILAQRLVGREAEANGKSVSEVIDRILQLRKNLTLSGLRTKDLIHQGHRY